LPPLFSAAARRGVNISGDAASRVNHAHTEGNIFCYGYRGFSRILFPGMFAQEEMEKDKPIGEIRVNP
jgi:hypothetical protein